MLSDDDGKLERTGSGLNKLVLIAVSVWFRFYRERGESIQQQHGTHTHIGTSRRFSKVSLPPQTPRLSLHTLRCKSHLIRIRVVTHSHTLRVANKPLTRTVMPASQAIE